LCGCGCEFYGYCVFEVGLGEVEKEIFSKIELKVL
jgi:hypothetical protein